MSTIAYREAASYPPAVTRILERFDRIEPLLAHRNLKHHGLTRLAPLLAPDPTPYDDGQADFRRHPHKRGRSRRKKAGGYHEHSHSSLPPPALHESSSDVALTQAALDAVANGGPLPPVQLRAPRPPAVPPSAHLAAGVYAAPIVPGMPRSGSRRPRPSPNVVLRRSPSPEADHPQWPEDGGKFPEYYSVNVIPGTWSTAFLRGLHKQFLESGTRAAAAAEAQEARQMKREEEQRRKETERKREAARRDKLVDRLTADFQRTTLATYNKKADSLQTLQENSHAGTIAAAPLGNAVRCRFNMSPSVGTWFSVSPATSRPTSRSDDHTTAMARDLADQAVPKSFYKREVGQFKVDFKPLDPEHARTKARSALTSAFENGALDMALRELMFDGKDGVGCKAPRPSQKEKRAVLDQLYMGALSYFVASQCECGNVFKEDSSFCRKCGAPRPQEDKFRRSTDSWHSSLDGRPLGEDYVASIKDESSVSGDWEIEHEVVAGDFIHHCFDHALDEALAFTTLSSTPVEAVTPEQAESPNAILESPALAESPFQKDAEKRRQSAPPAVQKRASSDLVSAYKTFAPSKKMSADTVESVFQSVGDIPISSDSPTEDTAIVRVQVHLMEEPQQSPSRERERRELEELRVENARLREQLATGSVAPNSSSERKSQLGQLGHLRAQACEMFKQAAMDGSLQSWLREHAREKAAVEAQQGERQRAQAELEQARRDAALLEERKRQLERDLANQKMDVETELSRQRRQVEEDIEQRIQSAAQSEAQMQSRAAAREERRRKDEVDIDTQRQIAQAELREKLEVANEKMRLAHQVAEDLAQQRVKDDADIMELRRQAELELQAAKGRLARAAEERRASEEADLKRKLNKSELRSHLVEWFWNGQLAFDLTPVFTVQRDFEPLRSQTRDMVANAATDGSLVEAIRRIFGDPQSSPTRQRKSPRKLDPTMGAKTLARDLAPPKSPVAWETKSGTPRQSPRHTPSPPLKQVSTHSIVRRPTPPALVPFATYYKNSSCTSNVCQGMAYALFPRAAPPQASDKSEISRMHSPRSPDTPAPAKAGARQRTRGATALLKSLRTGEVSKIVDEMEAAEASSFQSYYANHFRGSHVIQGIAQSRFPREPSQVQTTTAVSTLPITLAPTTLAPPAPQAQQSQQQAAAQQQLARAAQQRAVAQQQAQQQSQQQAVAQQQPASVAKQPAVAQQQVVDRATLQSMKQSELKKKAEAFGATKKEIGTTLDEDNPKAALIDLIMSKQSAAN